MNYEKKVIVYIDLLGFTSFINFTDKSQNAKETKIEFVKRLFELLKELTENKSYSNTCSREVTQFSDLIVISFAANDFESFFDEIRDIQLLCINCINVGFLVRGSIVYGDIIHNSDIIFGPGLVQAYEIEKTIAKYPRIIIDEVIIKDFEEVNLGILNIKGIVSIDDDGYYFVDYFSKAQSSLDETTKEFEKHIKNLSQIIFDIWESPILLPKANWLFHKFKNMLPHFLAFREDNFESNDIKDIEWINSTVND